VPAKSDELREIIARAQRNDQGAYEHIFNRYVDTLYRYLYMRCHSASLAEEALGELWLRVVQYLPHFRIPNEGVDQAFTSWMYRIARNLSVDMVRKDRWNTDALVDTLSSPEPNLEDNILAQDDRRSLSAAMEKLTVDQREVIHLRFHEDRTSAEVAVLTGRSETAVKALQHRALGALARAMGIERHTERNSW
jgi:RNA polymerase sigma-70 factor (ECF subfamily)